MNTIHINKSICEKNEVTINEILSLIVILNNVDLQSTEASLISKGYITALYDSEYNKIGWRVTNKGNDLLNIIILDSDTHIKEEDALESLAKELKNIFPQGKKPGTNYYWADGTAIISRRLKLFFKKYGTSYTNEQIISATRKYVQSFNSDYRFMKLLKYFIMKEKTGKGGDIEGESDLLTYIENEGQIDSNNDWTAELR